MFKFSNCDQEGRVRKSTYRRLNVFGVEELLDLWPDDVCLGAREPIENVLIVIECAQGATLILVNVQARLYRLGLVIIALNQRFT